MKKNKDKICPKCGEGMTKCRGLIYLKNTYASLKPTFFHEYECFDCGYKKGFLVKIEKKLRKLFSSFFIYTSTK